jgi:hypothetical protein
MSDTPKDLVDRLLGENDLPAEAERIYDKAYAEHPEWWDGYHQGEVDVDAFADRLLDKFIDVYAIEAGSPLADLVYEHIYAGLT